MCQTLPSGGGAWVSMWRQASAGKSLCICRIHGSDVSAQNWRKEMGKNWYGMAVASNRLRFAPTYTSDFMLATDYSKGRISFIYRENK